MKVIINTCFGGFGVSDKAFEAYLTAKGIEFDKITSPSGRSSYWKKGTYRPPVDENDEVGETGEYLSHYGLNRDDQDLVKVVETLGDEANGEHAELAIVEIPDDVKWHIAEYNGSEYVAENHRTWR